MKMTNEKLEHITRNLENPLIKKALNDPDHDLDHDFYGEGIVIRKAISDFYDVMLNYKVRSVGNDYCTRENEEKIGKAPEELIQLIGPFTKGLDSKKLTYEKVRKEVKYETENIAPFLFLSFGTLGGLTGTIYTLSRMFGNDLTSPLLENNLQYPALMASGAILLGGIYGLYCLSKSSRDRWRTPEYQEFRKLKLGAHAMDKYLADYKNIFGKEKK